ncbi:CoA pyrophosphatase [Flavobacteriaceae bacterium F89]|uniref:CoA pyrophosphatase n=1 Tax=Cerina litoralis TaxID=2874477 RepID=A0AAE3EU14_9FLAO|nr:CoA pyrophosphatase [Cerina litoralis]MCG2459591.1 CoA pyrophosphatase [Cerina litoralis]
MDFNVFSQRISKIKNLPLPGVVSHYKMAPRERIRELEQRFGLNRTPKKAGVMALFYPSPNNKTNVLLILRTPYGGVHSNQIGLPGGKQEKEDPDLLSTALRETYEEVGVPPDQLTVLRSLSQLYIPPSNFVVWPYMGLYHKREPFVLQRSEVAALVEVPLIDILDDRKVIVKNLTTSYAKNVDVPAFLFNGHVVWGATAMILSEIKELLKQVL